MMNDWSAPPIPAKANTTSSVYIGSTISAPNMKAIIRSMARVLRNQIQDDVEAHKKFPKDHNLQFFNEEKYIAERPEEFTPERIQLLREMPSEEHIHEFIYAIFMIAEFSHESCIISLIYLFRFINKIQFPLYPTTWRPLVFTSLLVAQKVVDDICLRNADFLQIYPFWDLKECNKLESKFLQMIEFDVNTNIQLYAQYFFELRSLCHKDEIFPEEPITADQANTLEARSKRYGEEEKLKYAFSNSKSLDYQDPKSRARAVLD